VTRRTPGVALAAVAVALVLSPSAAAAPPLPFGHACTPQNGVLFCPAVALTDRGSRIRLELLGRDAPYAQAPQRPFSVRVSRLRLELPVRERPSRRLRVER
jgi:hypothetical protein